MGAFLVPVGAAGWPPGAAWALAPGFLFSALWAVKAAGALPHLACRLGRR